METRLKRLAKKKRREGGYRKKEKETKIEN